ncbi:MAG: RNA 2'-phosphotransferase [Chloroflexi bacterium]|nr:RNA 2'-phosphotransferase [Chloroflexota bacterium]
MTQHIKQISKFLSLILRHNPGKIGLTLDEQGWAEVDELMRLAAGRGPHLSRELIEEVVATNDKQRFALSEDGRLIRANQGHSIAVDLGLVPQTPPALLYHGTANKNLPSIMAQGLLPGRRQHVHLSADVETAVKVGQRHGRPIVLTVQTGAMHAAGHLFYKSANGVWLVAAVPAPFIAPE